MKTKTRFHKLTAWLLTLAMLMTFMPSFTFTVLAAGNVASVTTADGKTTTNHTTITDAINTAIQNSGSTLKLLDNITTGSETRIDSGSFTIDLGGKTWTATQRLLNIGGTADIKITDSSADNTGEGTGMMCNTGYNYAAITHGESAKLEIAGGTVEHSGNSKVVDMSDSGKVTQAELIVSGGKLNTKGSRAIDARGKLVEITGGTFESTGETIYYSTGVIDLSGHTNPAGITIYNNTGAAVTPGENTIKLPTDYAMLNSNGYVVESLEASKTYTVGEAIDIVYVASVTTADGKTTTKYTDIEEAISAAMQNSGSTLKLLDNITTGSETRIDSGSFTIDQNGKTWTTSKLLLNIGGTADIKIIDSSADSTGEGTGKMCQTSSSYNVITLRGSAKLEIAGGTVEHSGYSKVVDMSDSGSATQAELIVSGGKLITNNNYAIHTRGKLVKVTGGTIKSNENDIYYRTGEIDLSEHKNPAGITIYFDSSSSPEIDCIKFPAGYAMQNSNGTVVGRAHAKESYTVCKAPEPTPGSIATVTTSYDIITSFYTDITSAINAASADNGSTLKLLDNITTDSTVAIDRGSFTIDLGGKTLTAQSVLISGDATNITITDSSADDTGMLVGNYANSPIRLDGNATLEIKGGTVKNESTQYAVDMSCNGKTTNARLIVSGGKLSTKGSRAIGAFGRLVEITGGTFESTGETIDYSTGVIDLSELSDPTGITISAQSTILVNGKILLPAGYVMLDEDGNAVKSLEVNGSYTVGECNHSGDNATYDNGFCINGCCQPATDFDEDGYYEIGNAGQLFWFAQQVNSGKSDINGKLTADIDLENRDWTTICETDLYYNSYGTDYGYSGTFDGNNHIIKNIRVTSSDTRDASCGLFGTVSGTIKNLGVEGFTFVDGGKDIRTGAIVGQLITANGKVSNCYVKGATIDPKEHVAGGIAGCVYDGTIENCYVVESTISGSSGRFGHIVGDSRGDRSESDRKGTVTNCYSDNEIILSDRVGKVTNCETKSKEAFASGEVAHLLGEAWGQDLSDAKSLPTLGGKKIYCDYNNGFCIHCGEPTSAAENNGIYEISNAAQYIWFAKFVNAGNTDANAKLMADIDLSEHGNVMIGTSSEKYSGNFDGNGKKLTVNFDTSEEYAAPFRYIDGATIQNLTVDGTIAISAKFAAGVVGSGEGDSRIEKCMVGVTINSDVNGDGTHGGLVAVVNSGSMDIDNCGFIGSITGSRTHSCGGFVGWANGKIAIKNSYISGTFTTGTSNCNTFGRNTGNITVSNSYYETTYGTDNEEATQKSAEQFASGEVAYLLGEAWGQDLSDANSLPTLGGKKVYCGYEPCNLEMIYSNTELPEVPSGHTNENNDHICDVCEKVLSECGDADGDHICDVCEKVLSECGDADGDHICDVCEKVLSECDYNNGFGECGCYQYATDFDEDGYYEIGNAGQLFWFAQQVNSGNGSINGKLTTDINLESRAWTPITNFSGTFDGAGYVIKNFAMNISTAGAYGLFGFVKDATIKDFTIFGEVESTLTAKPDDDFRYGVIADATGDTIITDVHSYVNFTIKDSYFRNFVGGILGRSDEATKNVAIERCSFGGTLNLGAAQVDCTGGIVAYVYTGCAAKLNNCLFDGEIISTYNNAMQVGGLLGYYRGSGLTITNALSIGDITVMKKTYMGSLVGILRQHSSANAMVKNNYYRDGNKPFGNSSNNDDITDSYQNQTVADSATAVKEAQLESGETAYLLGEAWGQFIGIDDYPVLGGAKVLFADGVYYNEINEFEILSNGTDGNKATATVAIPTAGTYTLIFADYEETRLNKVDTVTFTVTEDKVGIITVPSEIEITLGTNDKIMLWQDMTNLVPKCDAYIVK